MNEAPVVGSPLGFPAADWHLDAEHSVAGAELNRAGGWHHSRAQWAPTSQTGCVSMAAVTLSPLICTDGDTAYPQQEEGVLCDPCSPPNTGWALGTPPRQPASPVPIV